MSAWWVDLGRMPGAHQCHSITSLLSWTGERNMMRGLGVEVRLARSHSPVTSTGKTDMIQRSSVYYQSNQNRLVRKIKLNLKTPSNHPSLLPGLSLIPEFSTSSSPNGARGRRMGTAGSSPCCFHCPLLLPGEYFSHSYWLHLVVPPIGESSPQPESFP